jgi:hypothetical protein
MTKKNSDEGVCLHKSIVENVIEEKSPLVGTWGSTCECPNGQIYNVGDYHNACETLACNGGIPGKCNKFRGEWSNKKVTCNANSASYTNKNCSFGKILQTRYETKIFLRQTYQRMLMGSFQELDQFSDSHFPLGIVVPIRKKVPVWYMPYTDLILFWNGDHKSSLKIPFVRIAQLEIGFVMSSYLSSLSNPEIFVPCNFTYYRDGGIDLWTDPDYHKDHGDHTTSELPLLRVLFGFLG